MKTYAQYRSPIVFTNVENFQFWVVWGLELSELQVQNSTIFLFKLLQGIPIVSHPTPPSNQRCSY